MEPTGENVDEFVAAVTPAVRQRDAATMIELMRDITGLEPERWGTIIGFGACDYRYPTGTTGQMPLAAFAPRKSATTIYALSLAEHADRLSQLGPHTASKGCLYIKDLSKVDLAIVREIITDEYRRAIANEIPGVEITVK